MYIKIYNQLYKLTNYFRVVHLKLLGASIGEHVKVYGRVTVVNAKNLHIGDRVTLNEGVHINCRDKVHIGSDVRISTQVQIHTGKLNLNEWPRLHTELPVIIEDNVWIASSCVISAGVTIGRNSVVAAGAVVVKNISPNSLVGGIPAKVIVDIR
jgi:acetyltransferase-like isoleucine patch superfamily enzyme